MIFSNINKILLIALLLVCFASSKFMLYKKNQTIHIQEATEFIKSGISKEEKNRLLNIHNVFRNKVASGNQPGQPTASNMRVLTWDAKLEAGAQQWADRMVFQHSKPDSSNQYGENLAQMMFSDEKSYNPEKTVQMWFDEVKLPQWKTSCISKYTLISGVGHYTQVIWAETTRVGCGVSFYFDKRTQMHTQYTVCRYQKAGNYMGEKIYQSGSPCSGCPNGCHQVYKALCK